MSTLKQITTKAKALYKTGKYKKWTDAIKAASATISKKVKKTVTKKAAKSKIGYKKDRMDILFRSTPLIKKYRAKGWNRKDAIKNATIDAGFMSGTKKSKYKVNDKVYSYQNPDKAYGISIVQLFGNDYKYKIGLRDKDGYSYSSNWIDEKSISKVSRKSDALKVKSGKITKANFIDKWGSEIYLFPYLAGTKKKTATKRKVATHKDSKSHNTNITVVSGINKTKLAIAEELKTTLRDLANSQAMLSMLKERYKTTPKEWKKEVSYAIHQQKGRIAYLKNNLTRLKALIK